MSASKASRVPRIVALLGIVAGGCLLALAWRGRDYYLLGSQERPFHALHATLRPSGRLGLPLGIAGTALMILNLGYLARKRLIALVWLGSLRSWMSVHVFTGLIGPGLIVLHSAFAPRSSLGSLAFFAMLVVVLTGLVGRYIYARVPRSIEGRELEFDEIRKRLSAYRAELEKLGIDPAYLASRRSVTPSDDAPGVLRSLVRLVRGDPALRRDRERLRQAIWSQKTSAAPSRRLWLLSDRLFRERLWLARYAELRSLMGSWRFFHRWLALLMLCLVLFHVFAAVRFGDLFTFKGGR